MCRTKTPSFVYTMPLKTEQWQNDILDKRFESARHIYNAVLSEMLKRLRLMRQSYEYKTAKDKRDKIIRKALFKKAVELFSFTQYSAYAYATKIKNSCWIKDHIDAHTPQTIAARVFNAVAAYQYGLRGKPRFKSKNQIKSIEGKSFNSPLKFRDGRIVWRGLQINVQYDFKDKDNYEAFALSSRVKFIRILKKFIRNKERFYVQLILEGKTPIKQKHSKNYKSGIVGIDYGPSTIAAVSDNSALIVPFAKNLKQNTKKKKKLQRSFARKLRINNPDSYGKDTWVKKDKHWKRKKGRVIKGKRTWVKSKSIRKVKNQIRSIYFKITEQRKQLHGELANKLLTIGNIFKTENVSVKAWHKIFGKSIGNNAPSMFISILNRKAENAGGCVEKFSTYHIKLSQTCICGRVKKKKLSQRWHVCECGVTAQRDLFSAFLAKHVIDNRLDTSSAQCEWEQGVDQRLMAAVSEAFESASSWNHIPACLFGTTGQSRSLLKSFRNTHKVSPSREDVKSA